MVDGVSPVLTSGRDAFPESSKLCRLRPGRAKSFPAWDSTRTEPMGVVFRLEDDVAGRYSSVIVSRAQFGQLEGFDRRIAAYRSCSYG